MSRDTRAPADKFAAVENALDARVLAALAAAWKMAKDRQLAAGHYVTAKTVQEIATELAEPITAKQAADVIAGLNDAEYQAAEIALEEMALDHVWSVIA